MGLASYLLCFGSVLLCFWCATGEFLSGSNRASWLHAVNWVTAELNTSASAFSAVSLLRQRRGRLEIVMRAALCCAYTGKLFRCKMYIVEYKRSVIQINNCILSLFFFFQDPNQKGNSSIDWEFNSVQASFCTLK